MSENVNCRSICRQILKTSESTGFIIGELESGGCGTVLPHLPMWQCFLTADRRVLQSTIVSHGGGYEALIEMSQINRLGIDSAKLHCCEKAYNNKCRHLCLQTYTTDWSTSMVRFESSCLMHSNEFVLRGCIEEVDEPCQMGCDGLNFCTNFNNRPTELFRSCNFEADLAARSDLLMWLQHGYVRLQNIFLPIKNITRCSPEKWKAIACILQIKPCTRQLHYNHICREDCYEILNECLDWLRLNNTINFETICGPLHHTSNGRPSCIHLQSYLQENHRYRQIPSGILIDASSSLSPSIYLSPLSSPSSSSLSSSSTFSFGHRLNYPCKRLPCNESTVCQPLRNGLNAYKCLPACALGETSSYLVPVKSYVRIPVQLSENRAGFKVCQCGSSKSIEHCQPLPSLSYNFCVISGGRRIPHGTSFNLECNLCTCYAEEITCTKKQCQFLGKYNKIMFF